VKTLDEALNIALKDAGEDVTINVMPHAGNTLPRIQE
jgi:hypothetical protein